MNIEGMRVTIEPENKQRKKDLAVDGMNRWSFQVSDSNERAFAPE